MDRREGGSEIQLKICSRISVPPFSPGEESAINPYIFVALQICRPSNLHKTITIGIDRRLSRVLDSLLFLFLDFPDI